MSRGIQGERVLGPVGCLRPDQEVCVCVCLCEPEYALLFSLVCLCLDVLVDLCVCVVCVVCVVCGRALSVSVCV